MTALIFIVILGILIFVHELGHFLAARLFKVRVDEFALGFPPRIFAWKPKGGETTYALNLIPFGGYVKIFGENYEDDMATGTVPTTGAAIGTGIAAQPAPTGAGEAISADMSRSLINQPRPKQIVVLAAGVIFNVLFAAAILAAGFMIGMPTSIDESNSAKAENVRLLITQVAPDSPADKAGIKDGEEILDIGYVAANSNETSVGWLNESPITWLKASGTAAETDVLMPDAVRAFIFATPSAQSVIFNLKTATSKEHMVVVTPTAGIVEGQKAVGIAMEKIGIIAVAPHSALWQGAREAVFMTKQTVVGLGGFAWQAFRGEANLKQISGPVGIASMVGTARNLGFAYLISLTALISINLAVLNLVPFPALDGGRILFVIIEAVRRKRITPRIANICNLVGFIILMSLMLIITVKDVLHLF